MGRIVLCADTESLVRPMLLGLEDVSLDGRGWLVSIPDALEARRFIRSADDIDEVWVVSSDQLEAANLAAGIRRDDPDVPLRLIGFGANALEPDAVRALGVSEVWDVAQFCARFDAESRRRSFMKEIESLTIEESPRSSSRLQSEGNQASRDRGCCTISVLSGSGGVGKSSFIALAACMSQARGFRTAVIDADTQFGDVSRMIAKGPRVSMEALLENSSLLDDSGLYESKELPVVIEAPDRVELSEALDGRIADVVALCSRRFDVIYIDTGSSWTDDHVWILENSDCSLFLIDQRASSIRSAQKATDLCIRMGVATGSFIYVLNRCSRDAIFSGMDVANVMQGSHVVELKDGGSEVEEYLGAGLAAEFSSLRNECVASVDSLIGEVLPASAFFAGSPEWSFPPDGDRRGRHQSYSGKRLFTERRGRKRRRGKRSLHKGEQPSFLDGKPTPTSVEVV